MKVRIEPKKIDRLSNIVETVPIANAEFWGVYVERKDEEFDESYWEWAFDASTLDLAYRHAVSLGDACPTLRAA